ncbi:MAG: SDR family NAD(P)-dependent oxidoreductase [Microthrixaceae bacterium]
MSGIVTFDFSGATILVTGGTSGIGHSIASAFADAGADVIVTGTRSEAASYEVDLDRFGYRQLQITDPGLDRRPGGVDRPARRPRQQRRGQPAGRPRRVERRRVRRVRRRSTSSDRCG